jgi:hypothetical protein
MRDNTSSFVNKPVDMSVNFCFLGREDETFCLKLLE